MAIARSDLFGLHLPEHYTNKESSLTRMIPIRGLKCWYKCAVRNRTYQKAGPSRRMRVPCIRGPLSIYDLNSVAGCALKRPALTPLVETSLLQHHYFVVHLFVCLHRLCSHVRPRSLVNFCFPRTSGFGILRLARDKHNARAHMYRGNGKCEDPRCTSD